MKKFIFQVYYWQVVKWHWGRIGCPLVLVVMAKRPMKWTMTVSRLIILIVMIKTAIISPLR